MASTPEHPSNRPTLNAEAAKHLDWLREQAHGWRNAARTTAMDKPEIVQSSLQKIADRFEAAADFFTSVLNQLEATSAKLGSRAEVSLPFEQHPCDQIDWWATAYENEGGHGLIVRMLRNYEALILAREALGATGSEQAPVLAPCAQKAAPIAPSTRAEKSDEELLASAAMFYFEDAPQHIGLGVLDWVRDMRGPWNPLESDAQAFKLEGKVRRHAWGASMLQLCALQVRADSPDPDAVTRRIALKAAAALFDTHQSANQRNG